MNCLKLWIGLVLCSTLLLGCGKDEILPEGEKGTVKGKVTFQNKSIPAGSTINFVPQTKGVGIPAGGVIKEDGTYQLMAKSQDQILVGKYGIYVTPPPEKELTPEQAMEASMEGKTTDSAGPAEIPAKYRDVKTSGVVFEVKKGENEYNLDMKP